MARCRLVERDELNDLLELYQMLHPEDPRLETEEAWDQWNEMLGDDSLFMLVVEQNGQIVASCVLSLTKNLTRNARPFGVVENVITHEEHRGKGHGTRVLQKATEIAKKNDCYKLMLLTGTNQEWKLNFYEKCGFERDEKTGFVRYLD